MELSHGNQNYKLCQILRYGSRVDCFYKGHYRNVLDEEISPRARHKAKYVVLCDRQSSMDLSNNATYNFLTNHINVRYHWLHDVIEKQS